MRTEEAELDGQIDGYLVHLRVERNLSRNTLDAYGRDLSHFARDVIGRGRRRAGDVTAEDLSAWLQDLAASGRSARTQARMLVAVRGFYRYLVRASDVAKVPTDRVDMPKIGRPLPVLLDHSGVRRLLDAAGPSLLDRALVSLLYGAGLRVSEVVDLDLSRVHVDAGVLHVVGKGQKARLVPIGEPVAVALAEYLQHERAQQRGAQTSDAVFPGRSRSGRLSRQTVFLRLRKLALAAGLEGPVSPHKLRHGFATDLLRGGADLRSVQAMLGHADLRTTEIYTQVDDRHVRRVYQRTHPRK